MQPIKQICIIAGEASGDLHGASLVKALKETGEPLVFFGLGGPRLGEAGVEMVYPPPLNVVGFTEAVAKIAQIFRAYQRVKQALVNRAADLLVLIDYPELNLRLARFARRRNIPVLFYISPQVWAWRAGRVKTIARVVDRMAVILPFEEEFYRARGVAVEFVGHPLWDILEETPPKRIPGVAGGRSGKHRDRIAAGKPTDGSQSDPAGSAGHRLVVAATISGSAGFSAAHRPFARSVGYPGKGRLLSRTGTGPAAHFRGFPGGAETM